VELAANPVDKNAEGMADPLEHQKWYSLTSGTMEPRKVFFNNQCGSQVWRVTDPKYLVVPSTKATCVGGANDGDPCTLTVPASCASPGVCTLSPGPGTCTAPPASVGTACVKHADCDVVPGDGVCGGLNHFLCYDVTWGPHRSITVQLEDQFFLQPNVQVGQPRYWCNPVQKTAKDPDPDDVYPIVDPNNHLACYDIDPKVDPPGYPPSMEDQFSVPAITLLDSQVLCVPSTKDAWDLPTLSRWGFATLVGLLMLTTVVWVAYRRRPLAPGSAT
jgi:hypothetical protein